MILTGRMSDCYTPMIYSHVCQQNNKAALRQMLDPGKRMSCVSLCVGEGEENERGYNKQRGQKQTVRERERERERVVPCPLYKCLSPGVAIKRNKEGEEVGSRTEPGGEHAAIFSSALKRFTESLGWLSVCHIHQ